MTTADPADELFHPVGDHQAWSESYYFNFVDPRTGVGAFTRMGFRPNDGWADALHAVYLPEGRVAFTYGRRTDLTPEVVAALGPQDPAVGNLVLRRGEAFRRWDIVYSGEAQDLLEHLESELVSRSGEPATSAAVQGAVELARRLVERARDHGFPLLRKPVKPAALRALLGALAAQRSGNGNGH